MATMPDQLTAPYVFQYKYRRSTGPVLGRFLAGLRECRIFGVRASDGRVLVPPVEADPDTGAPLSELVEVAASGVVTSGWARFAIWPASSPTWACSRRWFRVALRRPSRCAGWRRRCGLITRSPPDRTSPIFCVGWPPAAWSAGAARAAARCT